MEETEVNTKRSDSIEILCFGRAGRCGKGGSCRGGGYATAAFHEKPKTLFAPSRVRAGRWRTACLQGPAPPVIDCASPVSGRLGHWPGPLRSFLRTVLSQAA